LVELAAADSAAAPLHVKLARLSLDTDDGMG
jgi:hypothetical protein